MAIPGEKMILIDTDIFVIDRLFYRDLRFKTNQKFLDHLRTKSINRCTSIYNLYELCGIMTFSMNRRQTLNLLKGFGAIYEVKILYPSLENKTAEQFFDELLAEALRVMLKKVAFLDSLIITIAESNPEVEIIVTWNAKHFKNKTNLTVQTPEEFLIAEGVTI